MRLYNIIICLIIQLEYNGNNLNIVKKKYLYIVFFYFLLKKTKDASAIKIYPQHDLNLFIYVHKK